MSYADLDLTGSLPSYKKAHDVAFVEPQGGALECKLEFEQTIFEDGLVVIRLGTQNVQLTKGVDWRPGDIDYALTARIKANNPAFNKVLLKSIIIVCGTSAGTYSFNVSMDYQCVYPVSFIDYLITKERVDVTPGLLLDFKERLIQMEALVNTRVSEFTTSDGVIVRVLDEDLTGVSEVNKISGERHVIDTYSGIRSIAPAYGAFYRNGFKLYRVDHPDPLVLGVDYTIHGFDHVRSRRCSDPEGVYNYVRILSDFAGEIELTYQAFGGAVAMGDFKLLSQSVEDAVTYLKSAAFLTNSGLGNAPIIKLIQERVIYLEDNMRQLLKSGTASYGDVTTGKAVTQRLRAMTTTLNWYTIARLYKVSGSDEIIRADRMHLRVNLVNAKIMADVIVSVNLDNADEPFRLDVLSINHPKGYTDMTDYSGLAAVIRPLFRVIYNKTVGTASGVYLQIGAALPTLEETIGIEDLSGRQSCWFLLDGVAEGLSPANNTVTLPNTSYVWSSTNNDSMAHVAQIIPPEGWLVYGGTSPIEAVIGKEDQLFPFAILPSFDLKSIKQLRFEFVDGAGHVFEFSAIYRHGKVMYIPVKILDKADFTMAVTVTVTSSAVNASITFSGTGYDVALRQIFVL